MHYMDNNAAVLKWSSEEIIIPYIFLEKKRRYFPDFYAEIVDKDNITTKYLIEVKPLKDTFVKMPKKMTPKAQKRLTENAMTVAQNNAKWEAARKFCEINNMKFLILTENEIFGK